MFEGLEKKLDYGRLIKEKESFESLLERFIVQEEEVQKVKASKADNYNIFDILAVRHYEAKVHSPFLAHLLDPKGSHEQGKLFYRHFIESVFKEDLIKTNLLNGVNLQVETELSSQYGFIDIAIRNNSIDNSFILIIENKIYAGDQERQLERYYEYARNILRLSDKQIRILYLKPNRARPGAFSINDDLYKKLKGNVLQEIGYKEDILPWLKNLKNEIKAERVKHSLQQYMDVIKTL